ncbi:MAG TPA: PadR family transcriptional regulator [Gammaproteobacteria bacterium]
MTGVPELLVLRLLSRREMYGYELVKAIRAATSEAIGLSEGVVYPALYALEEKGALKTRQKKVNGRPRIYYSVTPKGRRRLEELTRKWQRLSAAIGAALAEPGAP